MHIYKWEHKNQGAKLWLEDKMGTVWWRGCEHDQSVLTKEKNGQWFETNLSGRWLLLPVKGLKIKT